MLGTETDGNPRWRLDGVRTPEEEVQVTGRVMLAHDWLPRG